MSCFSLTTSKIEGPLGEDTLDSVVLFISFTKDKPILNTNFTSTLTCWKSQTLYNDAVSSIPTAGFQKQSQHV